MSNAILKKYNRLCSHKACYIFFRMIVRSTVTEKIVDFRGCIALIGNTEVKR